MHPALLLFLLKSLFDLPNAPSPPRTLELPQNEKLGHEYTKPLPARRSSSGSLEHWFGDVGILASLGIHPVTQDAMVNALRFKCASVCAAVTLSYGTKHTPARLNPSSMKRLFTF